MIAEAVDCVVIGAGVQGLAVARRLAMLGREVVVLEQGDRIGEGISSRNSEVIHAGIYYPPGSLKARLCVTGKALLYKYCAEHAIDHRRCGKLILATKEDQLPLLAKYQTSARANGAGELEWIKIDALRRLEPEVRALAGVLSPSTGIIDSHGLMLSLLGQIEACGGVLALRTQVVNLARRKKASAAKPRRRTRDGHPLLVQTKGGELHANWVINSGGLLAPDIARWLTPSAPKPYYARGRYYAYSGRSPFRHLVYPVAEPGGLGVHVTLDLAGQARFGPDVRWIDGIDHSFDDCDRAEFIAAIRRYYPKLDESRLHPAYTGIRPKIVGPGAPPADFRIDGPNQHSVPGLVNLLGIESPGLTACLAIAELVANILSP